MINFFKKKYKFINSIYILFLFFLIIFIKFSTNSANANTYKIVNLEISKPYDNNFNKEAVVDMAFVKAFEQLILKITTIKKNDISFQALRAISRPRACCKDPGSSILSSGSELRAEL